MPLIFDCHRAKILKRILKLLITIKLLFQILVLNIDKIHAILSKQRAFQLVLLLFQRLYLPVDLINRLGDLLSLLGNLTSQPEVHSYLVPLIVKSVFYVLFLVAVDLYLSHWLLEKYGRIEVF